MPPSDPGDPCNEEWVEINFRPFLSAAHYALEALRKPSDEMVWAVCETNAEATHREKCKHCPKPVQTPSGDGTQGCRLIAQDQIEALVDAALVGSCEET